jgi:hypothetical protein
MHWDRELIGTRSAAVCWPRGTSRSVFESFVALRFMGNLNDFKVAHPIHEPMQSPVVANYRRIIPPLQAGEGRGEGESFKCERSIGS